jgi:hypothetical protein
MFAPLWSWNQSVAEEDQEERRRGFVFGCCPDGTWEDDRCSCQGQVVWSKVTMYLDLSCSHVSLPITRARDHNDDGRLTCLGRVAQLRGVWPAFVEGSCLLCLKHGVAAMLLLLLLPSVTTCDGCRGCSMSGTRGVRGICVCCVPWPVQQRGVEVACGSCSCSTAGRLLGRLIAVQARAGALAGSPGRGAAVPTPIY